MDGFIPSAIHAARIQRPLAPLPDREVGAARARVLRQRGEDVRFVHYSLRGKARFRWVAAELRDPHAPRWSSARAAMICFQRECARRRSEFQTFAEGLQRDIVRAMGLPPELVGAGPRLGRSTPDGWL